MFIQVFYQFCFVYIHEIFNVDLEYVSRLAIIGKQDVYHKTFSEPN
jgi:hypothetical protein